MFTIVEEIIDSLYILAIYAEMYMVIARAAKISAFL